MERRRAGVVCAVSMTAGSALPVPGASAGTNPLAVLPGAGIADAAWTGYGGPCLVLCLGEAFALGITSLMLGVFFQPVIAGRVCGHDRMSLVLGGSLITMAAAGVLVFRNTLFPNLVFIAVSACIALGLVGCEARMNSRVSAGSAT